jgi:hypothetical protein
LLAVLSFRFLRFRSIRDAGYFLTANLLLARSVASILRCDLSRPVPGGSEFETQWHDLPIETATLV